MVDLPEALVTGRERIYIEHFLGKITHNLDAFNAADIDFYAAAYSQPGALRCAFGVYRAFEEDALENQRWVEREGKCKVPNLVSAENSAGIEPTLRRWRWRSRMRLRWR